MVFTQADTTEGSRQREHSDFGCTASIRCSFPRRKYSVQTWYSFWRKRQIFERKTACGSSNCGKWQITFVQRRKENGGRCVDSVYLSLTVEPTHQVPLSGRQTRLFSLYICPCKSSTLKLRMRSCSNQIISNHFTSHYWNIFQFTAILGALSLICNLLWCIFKFDIVCSFQVLLNRLLSSNLPLAGGEFL